MKNSRLWAAALLVVAVFIALNFRAFDGYFQDDELDNLSWAGYAQPAKYVAAFVSPLFSPDNFRPTGHIYFTLMGNAFGLDFPPFEVAVVVIHLLNGLLLFLLLRRLGIPPWCSLGSTAFFLLNASAFDAYWKPMYVFDLLCATFCISSLLFYMRRQYIPAFLCFWLAYKAKELAVMLPAIVLLYEYWLGDKRFLKLLPFFAVSLSFGLQGIIRNPNHHNDYSFHFTPEALGVTIPFYTSRFLFFPFSGLLLFGLAFVRDRRIWFGLAAMVLISIPLLFLPGRLYEAYLYLPLACATIALAAAATHVRPQMALAAMLLWLPLTLFFQRQEARAKIALDDDAYVFAETLMAWSAKNPSVKTFVYTGAPSVYHHWGITAAWNLAHEALGLKALYIDWPDATKAMASDTVAFGTWDGARHKLTVHLKNPLKIRNPLKNP